MVRAVMLGASGILSVALYLSVNYTLNRHVESRKFFCERWWLHPNWICVWRVPLGLFGLWLYFKTSHDFLGILIFTIAAVLDGVDGLIARACNLVTNLGKELDPLCDKLTYLPAFGWFAYRGDFSPGLVVAMCAVETFGQFLARPILKMLSLPVAANRIGKIKAVNCFALIVYQAVLDGGIVVIAWKPLSYYWLWACLLMAIGSILLKFFPQKAKVSFR
jgi:CDP-diacylglycerol--serine O-phosphatidyltransferase